MKLTATQVDKAKPGDKAYKLSDGRGLNLLVTPRGGRYWRMDYRFNGLRKTLALGVYPDVSLKKARERLEKARQQVADGIDPSEARKAEKRAQADSLEAVAREWFDKTAHVRDASYSGLLLRRLERDIFPWLGRRRINDIRAPELLDALRRIERRGAVETAHRVKQNLGQVFRFAIASGRAERDPTADLRGALTPTKSKSFASVKEPSAVGALLRAIDDYRGGFVTKCALQMAPLVFVRPGELRGAEWSEFDLDAGEWRIPAERMKMPTPHIVPLSDQVIEILDALHPLTGERQYLFPSVRTAGRPMSENTINAALRRLGYSGRDMTGHGFRSMASTLLNEQGWNRDAIERQLAHTERDNVRAAYNYAEYMPERRRMMQAWADYLDGLKRGADVVPIKPKAQ